MKISITFTESEARVADSIIDTLQRRFRLRLKRPPSEKGDYYHAYLTIKDSEVRKSTTLPG